MNVDVCCGDQTASLPLLVVEGKGNFNTWTELAEIYMPGLGEDWCYPCCYLCGAVVPEV